VTTPVAVVTGAGSGIGAAIALELGRQGYHVVVTDVDGPSASETSRAIESSEAAPWT